MKKLLFLVIGIVTLASCSKSPEDKANALIKEELNKVLYHAETYDPVETVLDSAFYPLDSPELFEQIEVITKLSLDLEEQQNEAKSAKSSMAIWDHPYQSAFARNQYNENKEKYEKASEKVEKLMGEIAPKMLQLSAMLDEKPRFIGYKALHSYRAQNNGGNVNFGHSFFLFDPKLEKVIYSCDREKYDEYVESTKVIVEGVKEWNLPKE